MANHPNRAKKSKSKFFGNIDGSGFRMAFANGYAVSVQWMRGTYSDNRDADANGPSRTAEVAVFDPSGEIVGDVYGWQTADQVAQLIAGVVEL